jgi:hypothetical protein
MGETMKVLKMKFGMSGAQVDAFGIRFYGNIDRKLEHLGTISEMLFDPDLPPMVRHKRITLWFTLARIRPYDKVSDLLGRLVIMLRKDGYEIIISSIDELVDTTSPEYARKPESQFPAPDRMHGYNAARGFSITAEKNDAKSKFTLEEIEIIQEAAVKFARTVYGQSLTKVNILN